MTEAEKKPEKKLNEGEIKESAIDFNNPTMRTKGLRLNIGSGADYKEGFINIDKYEKSADANWDIFNLPLRDASVAQIISYETVEHISMQQTIPLFKEWFRVLKNDGQVIITVPDIVNLCENLIKEPEDLWNHARMYGNQAHEGQFHKAGFTPKILFNAFGYAGFRIVNTAYYMQAGGIRNIYTEAVK